MPLQVYGVFVQGGHKSSLAVEVAAGLLSSRIILGRLRVLMLLKRAVWVHIQHQTMIEEPRNEAAVDFFLSSALTAVVGPRVRMSSSSNRARRV